MASELRSVAGDPTYAGALSFMRRRYSKDLEGVDLAVWGIPLDVTVTNRPGARFGPAAIRRASAILDADPQYPFGFDPWETLAAVDYGDCVLDLHHPETIARDIEEEARTILASGAHMLTLGGDHFVSYPLLKAHAERHGPLALVQFDAHQDTWGDDGRELSHGSFVPRALENGLVDPDRSIQVGIRTHAPRDCGIAIVDAYEAHGMCPRDLAQRIAERVGSGPAYLTFDIDCLDPAYAPGTGTPVAGGLSSAQALMTLHRLADLPFVGGDVVEVSPPYDHADVTAIAASAVAQHYVCALAQRLKTAG